MIVSLGVTAKTASVIPAPRPAARRGRGEHQRRFATAQEAGERTKETSRTTQLALRTVTPMSDQSLAPATELDESDTKRRERARTWSSTNMFLNES